MKKYIKKKKNKNLKEIIYLREVTKEKNRINNLINLKLKELIDRGESLSNYQLWIDKKVKIFIKTDYIIQTIYKDLSKEGFQKDVCYMIVKEEE